MSWTLRVRFEQFCSRVFSAPFAYNFSTLFEGKLKAHGNTDTGNWSSTPRLEEDITVMAPLLTMLLLMMIFAVISASFIAFEKKQGYSFSHHVAEGEEHQDHHARNATWRLLWQSASRALIAFTYSVPVDAGMYAGVCFHILTIHAFRGRAFALYMVVMCYSAHCPDCYSKKEGYWCCRDSLEFLLLGLRPLHQILS